MAFHHRKLLPLKPDPVGENSSAIPKPCPKICLPPCPDHCNAVPPPPPPPPQTAHHTSFILVIVLCFLGFAFLIVSYLSIIRYRSNVRNTRRRNLQALNDSGERVVHENHDQVLDHHVWYIRTVGLQQSVIDLIEVFKYKKGGGLVEGSDCSVCLSEFQEDENLKLLPKCSHAFHIHCIDTWLRSHKNCPVCRAPVVNEANVGMGTVEEMNSDSSGSDEGNVIENGSNLAEVGSDEEGGDGNGQMRVNSLEEHNSLSIEDDDEIPDKNYTNYLKDEGSSSTKEDEGTSNCHSEGEMKQTSEIVPRSGNLTSSIYNLVKSSSLGRSLQNVPSSMKKSFPSGTKSSLPTRREDSS